MTSTEKNQLIADVARDIVAQTELGEIPLFQAISIQYFKKPDTLFKKQSGKDEKVGIGIGETISVATPAVLVVMTQVVTFLAGEVRKSATEESTSLINEQVKRMFKKFRKDESKDEPAPLTLTYEQLTYVRKQAYEKFLQLKLSDTRANRLADAVVASLVVAPPPQGGK